MASTAFDTSDTVELKGKVRGVTRLSKKASALMFLGGTALMAFVLFSIYSMGDDGTSSSAGSAASDHEAAAARPNSPATASHLLAGFSDGQAVVVAQSGGPFDVNAAGALGPGFDLPRTPAAPQQPAAANATPNTASEAVMVPSTADVDLAAASPPKQLTREERRALEIEDQRAQLARQAREGGLELSSGTWGGSGGLEGSAALPSGALAGGAGGAPFGVLGSAGGGGLPRPLSLGGGNGPQDDQNKQVRKEQFLKDAQASSTSAYLRQTVAAPLSKYELKQGWQIPVALETGVNSDLPGTVCARVRENVFDSATGRYLLIPQGAKACGVYDSQVAVGQTRLLMAWQRLIFPDGSGLSLDGMPSADQAGYTGMSGDVDNHYFKVFGSAVMMSLISASVQLSQPQAPAGSNQAPTSGQVIAGAVGQQLGQVSTAMIQKQLQVQPTITQEPGYRFVIQVTKDILFPQPYRRQDF